MSIYDELSGLSARELQEKIITYNCDLAYEKALSATAQILCNEENRRLRVEMLQMETEKSELDHRLNLGTRQIEICQNANLRQQFQLTVAGRDLEKANSDLRACSRKNDALNLEITSVNSSSAILLADKVASESEVATLKTVVQNLNSQAEGHQTVLSEKSALERRLSSLQHELEALRRSAQLAQAAQQASKLEDERLQRQIGSLEAELDEERNQRTQAEERTEKASSVWETKYTTLEQRSNSFRAQLRVTMEQLKACQAELRDSRASRPSEPGPLVMGPGKKDFAKSSLKRNPGQQQDADSMIGTPGDMPATKKAKTSLTLPGDKSIFSMTPYINRTSNVAMDSPSSDVGPIDGFRQKQKSYDHLDDQEEPDETTVNKVKGPHAISQLVRPHSKAVQPKTHVVEGKGDTKSKRSLVRNSKISLSLEDVSETEENDLNDPLLGDKTIHKSAEKDRRKRKVLTGRLHKPAFKDEQSRKLGAVGKEQMPPPSMSTFGAISPLKRKRKPLMTDLQDATV